MTSHTAPSIADSVRPHSPASLLLPVLAGLALCQHVHAQVVPVGGTARNTAMVNRANGQTVRLHDFVDRVVLLDFFAYWCGPCQASSPDVERNVKQYYDARGGNAYGVPVAVVAVNVENDNEAATDQFIRNAGLEYVLNDYTGQTYGQFGEGYIPHFVVLSGVAGSPSHRQWEVLYSDSGYPGAATLRAVIDRVKASSLVAPPVIRTAPVAQLVPAGDTLRLDVLATGTPPLRYQWLRNGQPLAGATAATFERPNAQVADSGSYEVEVSNNVGSVRSTPVNVRVAEVGVPRSFAYPGPSLNIPDANATGVSAQIAIGEPMDVLRLKISYRIIHPFRGDLRVVLRAPGGQTSVLSDYSSDSGANLIATGRSVAGFAGVAAQGTWRLTVSDGYAGDVGRLESWSMEITPPADTVAQAFARWMTSFSSLTEAQRAPGADPDGDGVANFLEYALEGQSPVSAAPGPRLTPSATAPGYLEYVAAWRSGVDVRSCRVLFSETLASGSWQEVADRGTDLLVNRTDPGRVVVRCRKTLPRLFLQLRAEPGGF